jgi:hypothetical protein
MLDGKLDLAGFVDVDDKFHLFSSLGLTRLGRMPATVESPFNSLCQHA